MSRRSGPTVKSVCLNCLSLRRRNAALRRDRRAFQANLYKLQAENASLRQRVKDLEERLRTNASNSSIAPSDNPVGAPRAVVKRPTGRRRGGQPGHQGTGRKLLPPEQVDQVVEHRPDVCDRCESPLSDRPGDVVGRHQVAELPPRSVVITEHRTLACRCGDCGAISRGLIPPAIRASVTGPRLAAAIGLLSAFVHGSRRAIRTVVDEILGCPIALGSVSARERELAAALAGPYARLVEAVAGAKVKYVDETGWKTAGKAEQLFVAATADAAVFRIEKYRNRRSLKQLLDGKLRGVFCTDRAGIYDLLPLKRRGMCWAHLKRDFVRCMERGGASEAIGQAGIDISRDVFRLWRDFCQRKLTRKELAAKAEPLKERMHRTLERGASSAIAKTAGLCRGLLKREQAMWNWTRVPGLEPTNNLAERMLRPAVIWRKKSFGSDSRGGCTFVERTMSVVQTLRQRSQGVLPYLMSALTAKRSAQAPPAVPECQKTD